MFGKPLCIYASDLGLYHDGSLLWFHLRGPSCIGGDFWSIVTLLPEGDWLTDCISHFIISKFGLFYYYLFLLNTLGVGDELRGTLSTDLSIPADSDIESLQYYNDHCVLKK